MIRLLLATGFAMLLLAPAASAEDAKAGAPESLDAPPALTEASPEPAPTPKTRRRLTTAERWRGKPYLRSSEDGFVRGEVLNRALPPANPGFGTGGMSVRSGENQALRAQALDMALPPVNRSFPGGF